MAKYSAASARRLVFDIHLWTALILFLPLVVLGLSGTALMVPQLKQLGQGAPQLAAEVRLERTPSQLLNAAMAALAPGASVQTLRLPQKPGEAAAVTARLGRRGPAQVVWVHPATGSVLKIGPANSPAFQLAHDLHGRFLVQGLGRTLVGWAGVAMLLLSLSGVWLWWPRGGSNPFAWRRTPDTLNNLHHFAGFWLSIPLAVVSATGILISFPPLTQAILGGPSPAQAPARPDGDRDRDGQRGPRLSPDQAVSIAQAAHPSARPVMISLPGAPAARRGPPDPSARSMWRVEFAGDPAPVQVDDRTAQIRRPPAVSPASPTSPATWVRRIHEGSVGGPAWWGLVLLTGLLPALLAFSGVWLWARNQARRRRRG